MEALYPTREHARGSDQDISASGNLGRGHPIFCTRSHAGSVFSSHFNRQTPGTPPHAPSRHRACSPGIERTDHLDCNPPKCSGPYLQDADGPCSEVFQFTPKTPLDVSLPHSTTMPAPILRSLQPGWRVGTSWRGRADCHRTGGDGASI